MLIWILYSLLDYSRLLMRIVLRISLSTLIFFLGTRVIGQSCISTGLNGFVFSLPCNVTCSPMKFQIPHLKSTGDYKVVSIPYAPYPYVTPTGVEPMPTYTDDRYSPLVSLPFNFCFYDSVYGKIAIGTNGIITFDESQAGTANAYPLHNGSAPVPIPYAGGSPNSSGTAYYPKASIMGAYHDIDPQPSSTVPPDRKIEYSVVGTAPCRKFVVSYYKVPMFKCTSLICTEQIVLHESTGLVEVFLGNKPVCTTWTDVFPGRAILGVQNWNRDKAVAAPGKNATIWEESNTAYRFVPSGATSRFIKAELCSLNGTVLATTGAAGADTATTIEGVLDLNFPQQCLTVDSNKYLVRTYFSSCSDATQLTSTDTITVKKTTSLKATIGNITPAACSPSGSIKIDIPTGAGTLPYSLTLDGGLPVSTSNQTYTFSGLISGDHTIIITTAGGCSQTITANVPVSNQLAVTHVAVPPTCNGSANGSITINPSNGIAPFTYSINNGAFQANGGVYNNLPAGTYFISIKDNSGCFLNNYQVALPAGAPLAVNSLATPPACPGAANGSITVTPSTGTSPYQYSINNGAFQASPIFNNLPTGDYFISITDAIGCYINNIYIPVGPSTGSLNATLTPVGTSCAGVSNGSINIASTNGSAPFQYSLNGAPFQTGNVISGLAPGTYNVVVKDAAGCTSASLSATVNQGSSLLATAVSTQTTCNGATNGTITVTPTNGAGPYTFKLDSNTPQSSNVFSNVTGGTHAIIVTDGAGCVSASIPVTVATGPALAATVATTPTACSGATNGTITITPTNGSGTFQYSIDGNTFQASNTFSGLATGNYTITYKNNLGCQSTIAATVNPGQPLSATVATSNVFCTGGSTGTATLTISTNSAPPYQFSLNGTTWQASNVFNGLNAGSYSVQFKDNNNCSGSTSFTITQPQVLVANGTVQAVKCKGQSNGSISAMPTGGALPYQYSINGNTYQSANSFAVAAGSYTLSVKDNNGCIQTQSLVVTEPTLLSASATTTAATCEGGANGSLIVSAAGGTAPYQYAVGTASNGTGSFQLTGGNYSATVTDANNCTATAAGVVALTNNLTLSLFADQTICEGRNAQLGATTNATQFAWSPAASVNNASVKDPLAGPSTTTQYILTATLGLCSIKDTVTVNVLPAPVADAGVDGDICYGQSFQLQGNGGITYEWSPSTSLSSVSAGSPSVQPDKTTQYSLSVTDANGCRSLQADLVTVHVTPPIVIKVNNDTAVANGDVIQLIASSVATDYVWSPAFGLDNPTKSNPLATVTGDVTYTVVGTTSAGCKGEASVTLKVYEGPEIYVPTAFTPNGDGRNDQFRAFPVGIKTYTYFRVYNRWGEMIFSTLDFGRGWDGTVNGKQQPTGTYVWMVEGITKDNKKISKRGTVTLIR